MMTNHYKRRTSLETEEMAKAKFRADVALNLNAEELEEFRLFGAVSSGSPQSSWDAIVGREVTDKEFYEYKIYKPSSECPYVERVYALILVSRLRESEQCYFQWKPAVEPYNGPWFS